MKHTLPKVIHSLVLGVLVIVLVLVVWQPVLPSSWIIHGLARQIDPQSLSLEEPAVLRFELAGRGGGDYNLIISRDGVEVTEGDTGHVDLIIRTRATDFNQLMFQMAQGKAGLIQSR